LLDEPLLAVFPDLFDISRPIATPDVPVIVAATMLTTYDAPMLPLTKVGAPTGVVRSGIKLYEAIGSYPIIRMLVETDPKRYYKVLWNSCSTIGIWIGTVEYNDTLGRLLEVFAQTGFGDARVDGDSPPPALITLNEVVSLYKERRLKCTVPAKEVGSPVVTVDPGTKLIDAMRTMCEKQIRRLFVRGKKGEFISDRGILSSLFSPKGLKVARDTPEVWTDSLVADLPTSKADLISQEAMVQDVGTMVSPGRDVFATRDGSMMLSRWDLVMKPWKSGQLYISP
jgi:CBS domain-containing protein